MVSMSGIVQLAVVKSLAGSTEVEINADAVRVLVTSQPTHVEILNLQSLNSMVHKTLVLKEEEQWEDKLSTMTCADFDKKIKK